MRGASLRTAALLLLGLSVPYAPFWLLAALGPAALQLPGLAFIAALVSALPALLRGAPSWRDDARDALSLAAVCCALYEQAGVRPPEAIYRRFAESFSWTLSLVFA